MKRNVENLVLIVIVVVMLLGLLGGCCCINCVCPPIQETVLDTIPLCVLLEEYVREWTPEAAPREMTLPLYVLPSKAAIENALSKIEAWGCCINPIDLVKLFHELEGYELVPFGYVVYPNNVIVNVVVCKVGQEIKAFLLRNRKLEELTGDPLIEKIVL